MKQHLFQKATGTNGVPSKKGAHYSSMDLDSALLATYDLMWRCLLQYEFIVVGETGKCIRYNKPLTGDKIEILLSRHRMTEMVTKTIEEWADTKIKDNEFVFRVHEIPVHCKIIDNEYDFLKNADLKVYGAEQYKIPNPWEAYERQEPLT